MYRFFSFRESFIVTSTNERSCRGGLGSLQKLFLASLRIRIRRTPEHGTLLALAILPLVPCNVARRNANNKECSTLDLKECSTLDLG